MHGANDWRYGVNFDPVAYREQSRETWGKMATGWEDRNEWMIGITAPVSEWIVDRADPKAGATVLEIAAGPGDLGFRVAERLGDSGRLISTDFAPEMVETARRLGSARGIGNVEHRVLDAERMDLDDDSVDAVLCRWGYMLMADPAAALKETRRVLRDGGQLAFAVWAPPDRNPWAAIPGMTLVQRGHMPPPEPGAPGIFAMGDTDRVRELVTGAGFDDPEIDAIEFEFRYSDEDDVWGSLVDLAGPFAEVIEKLDDEERAATRAAILDNLAPFRQDDGSYAMPAMCWGVLAR
jgi:SAM-dependent methyltransferase